MIFALPIAILTKRYICVRYSRVWFRKSVFENDIKRLQQWPLKIKQYPHPKANLKANPHSTSAGSPGTSTAWNRSPNTYAKDM
jgi:hypothetical protein